MMDSKNIHISSQTYLKNMFWLPNGTESEWNFIGNDVIKLQSLINSIFKTDQTLYLVTDRHNSLEEDKIKILEYSKLLIEQKDFLIWDIHFKKVVEFNKIGVYRIGNLILK